jgi:hypothetical protein
MKRRIFLPLTMIALALTACGVSRGSGKVATESRDVRDFDAVQLSTIGQLILTQGEKESLQIEAEDNVIPTITTQVTGGTLIIATQGFPSQTVVPTRAVKFYVTMRAIHDLRLSGAGSVHASSIETDDLELSVSGAGSMTIGSLIANTVDVNLSGVGGIDLAGTVREQRVAISGTGSYRASRLESQTAELTITGAGGATVWVEDTLDANISGLGDVEYYGSPAVTQNVTGAGRVNSLGGTPETSG